MPARPRSILLLTASVLALVVAVAVALVLLPPFKSRDVGLPPDSAEPDEVVVAYLDALDAHDCDTAKALMTGGAREIAADWCTDVASLDDIEVGGWSASGLWPAGAKRHPESADVAVTFDLDWRIFHGDISMPEGKTPWGYQLVRTGPDGPWRISGQGTG